MDNDTIVAIATGPGRGGIGIVRLSGPLSYAIACHINQQKSLSPRYAHFQSFYDEAAERIDEGVVLYFPAPNSFTGEDVVEFQGHGAPVVLDRLVRTCIHYGARIANPGEFSLRAFLNEKIDLVQAEAIADLIHASSESAAKMAMRSLQGEFSNRIRQLSEQLITLRMYVEAAIDFPEEEVDFLSDGHIETLLTNSIKTLIAIQEHAKQGVMMQEGLSIVIAGKPNAGKSTLMNQLSGKDVAIVTDIAGTTRDVMRERVLLDDIPIHLIDTAGIRESSDAIEQEGIKRALAEIERADCVLWIKDMSSQSEQEDIWDPVIDDKLPPHVPIIQVYNKIDLLNKSPEKNDQVVYLCAKSGVGLDLLKTCIQHVVGLHPAEGQFLARRRHLQALEEAFSHLQAGYQQLKCAKAGELLAEELRLSHHFLSEITGDFTSDDLLGVIFSSFCIGK